MKTYGVSSFGRAHLGADKMLRLRLHLTATALQLVGPAPWTIRLSGAPGQSGGWERYGVGSADVWSTIVDGLAELGVPLPSDEEWERIRADMEAVTA